MDIDNEKKINELANNPQVKELMRKIMNKIESQKKYKKNSIEMRENIKKMLNEIAEENKKKNE